MNYEWLQVFPKHMDNILEMECLIKIPSVMSDI